MDSYITKKQKLLTLKLPAKILSDYAVCLSHLLHIFTNKNSEYDQEIQQSQTADKPVAS